MPVPSAVISVPTWSEDSMRSKRARSTLRILPRSGSTAWFLRFRPCLAEPPAESPSTMHSSLSAGSFSWESASLPGRPARSEEHTSELQSLMRRSYAIFCLNNKKNTSSIHQLNLAFEDQRYTHKSDIHPRITTYN